MLQLTITGLASGAAYAVVGCCLVLLYQTTGALNLSQAAIGAMGVYAAASAYEAGLTAVSAAVLAMLVGIATSVVVGALMATLFAEHTEAVKLTAMIAVTVGLMTLGLRLFGDIPRSVAPLIPVGSFDLGGLILGYDTFSLVIVALVLTLAATIALQRTRLGAVLRAVSQRPATAELLGVSVRSVSIAVWTFTGATTTMAMLILAPARSQDFRTLGLLVLPSLAAALVGAFRSLPGTLIGGLALGVIESVSVRWSAVADYKSVLPFLFVIIALLWLQRKEQWDAAR